MNSSIHFGVKRPYMCNLTLTGVNAYVNPTWPSPRDVYFGYRFCTILTEIMPGGVQHKVPKFMLLKAQISVFDLTLTRTMTSKFKHYSSNVSCQELSFATSLSRCRCWFSSYQLRAFNASSKQLVMGGKILQQLRGEVNGERNR